MLRFFRPARALPLLIAILLAAPAAADAYQVTIRVHGAGGVTEITDAGFMDCTTPSAVTELTVTNCIAGTSSGGYGSGWIVELQRSLPQEYFDRGWRFQKWVDGNAAGQINCDPQDSTGDHLGTNCKFQIFANLSADLYFDDVAGPSGTAISGGPTGTTGATSATFNFGATDDPDANFQCRLDRPGQPVGSYFPCGSSFDHAETFNSLTTSGSYTFNVRGVDLSGNMGNTVSRTWNIDTTPPTTSISGGPAGSRTTSTSASFGLSASEPASFQCKLDTPAGPGSFGPCSGAASMAYSNLADGTYTFSARAIDGVGLVGPAASRTWTVDTQPPDTSISGSSPSGATPSNSPTFGFTSSEANSTFECKLDTGSWEPCNSGSKSYTSLADGEHTFRVRAKDATALTDPTEAVRTWTIDTVTPDTTINTGPSGDTTSTTASFGFSATEAGTTFECKLDGGTWESCTTGKTYSGLGTGPHTFLVRATDAAGNTDASEAVRAWTVTAPTGGGDPGGTQTGGNADTTKPVATIAVVKQKLARVLKLGLVGSAASSEGGKLRLDVLMGRKRLLVATSNNRTLGGPGSMKLTAKFTRKAKRTLAAMRAVKLTLRLTATDAAGNVTVKTRSVTLKR